MKKRIISALLALAMALTLFSAAAAADGSATGCVAVCLAQEARDGETLLIPEGGEIFICFTLTNNTDELVVAHLTESMLKGDSNDLAVCWDSGSLSAEGFEVDSTIDEDGDTVYARVNAADKKVGEKGTLYYGWYRAKDIYGANAVGLENAEPVYAASVVIEVAAAADGEAQQPVSTAYFITQAARDGETLYMPEGGEMFISFEIEGVDGLICGWRSDLFGETGFGIDFDPTIDEDGTVYAHILAGDKKVGDSATLIYNWYRASDVFDDQGGMHWDTAVPLYNCSVVIEVAEDPVNFAFVDGSDFRYLQGDVIEIPAGEEILLANDLTYYADWWLPYRDLSELEEAGFTVYDELVSYQDDGYHFNRIGTEGLAPGTRAKVYFKWYSFDDFISGDLEGKPSYYPGWVTLEVIEPEEQIFILGDADCDGTVTIIDATVIQRYLADIPVKSFNMLTADANRNGVADITDATAIQRYLADYTDHEDIGEEVNYGTYYALWNIGEELLPEGCELTGADAENAKAEIRNALSLLVDRRAGIFADLDKIPANTFVPKWVSDADGSEFHANAGAGGGYFGTAADDYAANIEAAVTVLKKYYDYDEESGKFTNVPALTYIHNNSGIHAAIGEAVKAAFESVGIEVTRESKEWDSYSQTLAAKGFSLARSGWLSDNGDDPMGFLYIWTSDCEYNDSGLGQGDHADVRAYSLDLTPYGIDVNVENGTWAETYDVLIEAIKNCSDKTDAYAMMHIAEDMLMSTGCVMPLYYY